jgi:excisionase family DNA binding protein
MATTFLTGKEIADALKISKALAYRLIARGEIPSLRFGRVVRVRTEDLEQFIEAHRTGSGSGVSDPRLDGAVPLPSREEGR